MGESDNDPIVQIKSFAKYHPSGYATSGCYSYHGMEKVVGLAGVMVAPTIESPPQLVHSFQQRVTRPDGTLDWGRLRASPAPKDNTFASQKNSTFPSYQFCDQKPLALGSLPITQNL
jgi:hypothetical protein